MGLNEKLKAALDIGGKKRVDYANKLEILPQSLQNKWQRKSFTIQEIVKLCDLVEAELCIVYKDGQKITINMSDIGETKEA